jgi:hypothetical protein
MRKFAITLCAGLLLAMSAAGARAVTLSLADYALNIGGVVTTASDPLPATVDASGFDFVTGLGTLLVTFHPGVAGSYFVGAFVDHEIDEPLNTFFNEFGSVSGLPAAGQSWEIDEPGFVFGDIFANFLASALDNTNGVPAGSPDDVSMAMGWVFHLPAGMPAKIKFTVSTLAPAGFFLSHTDPASDFTIYFSSNLNVVPEPGTIVLMSSGLVGLLALGRKRWRHKARQEDLV